MYGDHHHRYANIPSVKASILCLKYNSEHYILKRCGGGGGLVPRDFKACFDRTLVYKYRIYV